MQSEQQSGDPAWEAHYLPNIFKPSNIGNMPIPFSTSPWYADWSKECTYGMNCSNNHQKTLILWLQNNFINKNVLWKREDSPFLGMNEIRWSIHWCQRHQLTMRCKCRWPQHMLHCQWRCWEPYQTWKRFTRWDIFRKDTGKLVYLYIYYMKHIHTKCQVCGDWSFCHRNLEFVDEVLRARDWYFLGNSWRWRARHDCGSPLSTQPIKQWRKRHLRQVKFWEVRFRHFAISFSMAPAGIPWEIQEYDWHRWSLQQRCRPSPLEHKALRTEMFPLERIRRFCGAWEASRTTWIG